MQCDNVPLFYQLANSFPNCNSKTDQVQTPRRSPRARDRTFDIDVHERGLDMKVSGHADVLHKVCANATLKDITLLLKTDEDDKKLYTPAKGLYWPQKGTKQLVSLKSAEGLQTCKDVYKGNLRLSCYTVSLEKSSGIYFVFTCFLIMVLIGSLLLQ